MSSSRFHPDERWTRLLDRDIDRLMKGEAPDNTDLAPLMSVLDEVRAFSTVDLSDSAVESQAAIAGEIVRTRAEQLSPRAHAHETGPESRFRQAFRTLRTRATATLASFAMLSGLTGVAWASDGAVPGDWNYGIDKALESIGIGAGGAEERLAELLVLQSRDEFSNDTSVKPDGAGTAGDQLVDTDRVGLEIAADSVIMNGAEKSQEVRNEVSQLLQHLLNSGDVTGADIAAIARGIGGPPEDHPGNQSQRPDDPGKPDNPGSSESAGSKSSKKP